MSMKKVIGLLLLMFALVNALPSAVAQEEDDWLMVLYFPDINDNYLPMWITPSTAKELTVGEDEITDVGVSPNSRYFLFSTHNPNTIYLSEDRQCCVEIDITDVSAEINDMYRAEIHLCAGGINNDASQFILYGSKLTHGNYETYVFLIDRASSKILARAVMSQRPNVKVFEWTDEGARIINWDGISTFLINEADTAPDLTPLPRMQVYDLTVPIGQVSDGEAIYEAGESTVNQEIVQVDFSAQYPYTRFGQPNIVTYNWDTVIYLDAEALDEFDYPRWVLNGEAVFLGNRTTGDALLIFRDGHKVESGVLAGYEFMIGTPTGWLARSGNVIYHYTLKDGAIAWDVVGNAHLEWRFQLGYITPMQPSRAGFAAAPEAVTALQTATPTPSPTPTATLTPTYVPAPLNAEGTSQCAGFLPSQLTIGEEAMILPGEPNSLRDTPGRAGRFIREVAGGETVKVLAGPTCADESAYWQVRYQGEIGWTAEGQGSTYWVVPMELARSFTPTPTLPPLASATPTTCAGFLPSRLTIGGQARILPGDANNLRTEPNSTGALLGTIPGGADILVLNGPVCADNRAYWQVQYGDLTGWTAEGQGEAYWIEPQP